MKKITRLNPGYGRKTRSASAEELVSKLATALDLFVGSPAAVTLANLPLSVFADPELIKIFPKQDVSVSDLVKLGAQQLVKLCKFSPNLIGELAQLLNRLSGKVGTSGTAELHTLFARPASVDQTEDIAASTLEPSIGSTVSLKSAAQARLDRLSSVAAEQALLDGQAKLKGHAQFRSFKSMLLRDFWPDSFPLAPFIETISFGQLANMPVSHLLEKRTFSEQKVTAVLGCIDRVCNEFGSGPVAKPETPKQANQQVISDSDNKLLNESLELQAFAALLERDSPRLHHFWWGRIFSECLTVDQQALTLVALSQTASKAADANNRDSKKAKHQYAVALRRLERALKESAGPQVKQWQELLKLAAVPVFLFCSGGVEFLPQSLEKSVLAVCLASLGGRRVKIGNFESDLYYSGNQHLQSQIAKRLRHLRNTSKTKEMREYCKACLPHLSTKDLKKLLSS